MEISGTILNIYELQTGTGKESGKEWSKRSILITTGGRYAKEVALELWNESANMPLSIGQNINASIDIQSREFNGKLYTTVSARNIEIAEGEQAPQAATPQANEQPSTPPPVFSGANGGDIVPLPF